MARQGATDRSPVVEAIDPDRARAPAGIRTFLIADVRGYTSFTHEQGDEAAARLAVRFADLTREAVEAGGGSVVELPGDEALGVFESPRQALHTAVELQARLPEVTAAEPGLPLRVGISLDAGEAVPIGGGCRGAAPNLAARLSSLAGPGEVIASREIAHLARKVKGLRYVDRGPVRLEDFSDPVEIVDVRPEVEGGRASRPFASQGGAIGGRPHA